jgi:DNA-binding XRE family transcriptional regulator
MTPAEKMAKSIQRSPRKAFRGLPRVFSCNIKEKRETLGLSQRDVCRGTGLTVSTVCRVEQGIDLTLTRALKLAKFFGCSIHEIWKFLNESNPS